MNVLASCPRCGAKRPAVAPAGLCAGCLLRLAEDAEPAPSDPTVADLAAVTHREATPLGLQFYSLGDYQLVGELARGGMGLVFRAWHGRLKRHVALKLMLPNQLDSASRVRRFRIEAEATARLEHPNIVPIYEIGEVGGQHFLCMKLIQGETLGQVLARGRFEARRASEFVATLAQAVHYAHQRGVLHRDLKPGNILVDEFGQPQVTDFGLARLLERDPELTQPDAVLGTPAYMAPEQAAGRTKDLTVASDIYSLGVVLYEMLTGRTPFRADTTLELLRQVRECEPPPPRRVDRKIPRDLDTICRKCLRKEPERRYATAQALADDLRRFLRGEPVSARPVAPLTRAALWCRRNPGITALLVGILTLLILFTGAGLFERAQLLRDKQSFAGLVAERVLAPGLAEIGHRVEEEAAALGALLSSPRQPSPTFSVTNELARLAERHSPAGDDWATIENWVLMNGEGKTLGRWPPVEPDKAIGDRSPRDYFRGALSAYRTSGRTDYYISAVYDSKEDGLRKIGVSVVLPGVAPGEAVGVLTAMLRTTPEDLAGAIDIHHHEVVVVVRRDPSTLPPGAAATDWVIHLHPAAPETRTNILVFPARWIARTNLTLYFDPARRSDPIRGWTPWLVGLAQVKPPGADEEPKLVVLVQSRDWIIVFLIPGLLLTTVLLGLAAWQVRRKERRT
jgi:serine/threonine-protein kinase